MDQFCLTWKTQLKCVLTFSRYCRHTHTHTHVWQCCCVILVTDALPGSCGCFPKRSSPGVYTIFKCFPLVFVLLLSRLGTCWHTISSVLQGSEHSERMLQWVVRVKEQAFVCMCGFPLYSDAEALVFLSLYSTVKKELDLEVHLADVFCEGPGFSFWPMWCPSIYSSSEGVQDSAFNFPPRRGLATTGRTGEFMAQLLCFCFVKPLRCTGNRWFWEKHIYDCEVNATDWLLRNCWSWVSSRGFFCFSCSVTQCPEITQRLANGNFHWSRWSNF